jgi:hypothetical protein
MTIFTPKVTDSRRTRAGRPLDADLQHLMWSFPQALSEFAAIAKPISLLPQAKTDAWKLNPARPEAR